MDLIQRIFELATLLIGVAVLTLLIGRPDATAQVVGSTAGAFNGLLRTVTLQDSNTGWGQ